MADGGVRGPADLYRLRAEDLRALAGVGDKTARVLIAEIEASRTRAGEDGARLLAGLGLPGVGSASARRLAESFDGLAQLAAADEEALRTAGLGQATSRGVREFLAKPEVRAELSALRAAGVGERWSGPSGGSASSRTPARS